MRDERSGARRPGRRRQGTWRIVGAVGLTVIVAAAACGHEPSGEGTTTTVAGTGAAGGSSPTGTASGAGAVGGATATGGTTSSGGSSSTGGGGVGGATPTLELAHRDLIVRYYVDEADQGQTPTALVDAAPDPLDLNLVWGAELQYTENADGNRGLWWNAAGQYSRASVAVDGTKISQALHGSGAGTIEAVVEVSAVTSLYSRLSHIGAGSEGGVFSLRMPSTTRFVFNLNEERVGWWEVDFASLGRLVVHAVLDTSQAAPADRVKLYVNGAVVPPLDGYAPAQNEVIDIGIGRHYVLGNREIGERTFAGTLYYAAMYGAALSESEVLQNTLILATDDDTPAVPPR